MIFLGPSDLRTLTRDALEELLRRSEMLVVAAEGEVVGTAAAALLFADYAAMHESASLVMSRDADVMAGAVWRRGRGALLLHLQARDRFTAMEAREELLCDEVITTGAAEWFDRWMLHRSALAVDSAAMLMRSRGGDRLERAEFARLFAAGEPQKGLEAFLGKRRPVF